MLIQDGNSRFDALCGGSRYFEGAFLFRNLGESGDYWSSTESDPISYAYYYHFDNSDKKLARYHYEKKTGKSCRCIQD